MRLIAPLLAAVAALGVMIAPAFAVTPTLLCSLAMGGTASTYNLPTDCGVSTGLLTGGYHSVYVNMLMRCDDTAHKETSVYMRLNGDTGTNYDYSYNSTISGINNIHNTSAGVYIGQIPCELSGTDRPNAAAGMRVYIPYAASTSMDKAILSLEASEIDQTLAWSSIAQLGGNWHRPSPGAVNRMDIYNALGANFEGLLDVYVE